MAADAGPLIQVEVIHARPGQVWRTRLELPAGATVQQALQASGVFKVFPELGQAQPTVGIFGLSCSPKQALRPGDRVEVYRPLVFDPMESRRRRARHRQKKGGKVAPGA